MLSSNDLSAATGFLSWEEAAMKYSAKDSKAVSHTELWDIPLYLGFHSALDSPRTAGTTH